MTKVRSPSLPEDPAYWKGWAGRLRAHCKHYGFGLAQVAERMGRAESTVRSWTNGTRDMNLSEFFVLCDAARADPAAMLFGHLTLTSQQKDLVRALRASFKL